jgi:hypothetical protein
MPDVVCCWTGTLSDILAHIRDVHDTDVAEMPEHFMVKLLDFVSGIYYAKLVLVLGEFFMLFCLSEDNIFEFAVFHICCKEEAENFKYGIKIGYSEEFVTVTCKCNSWMRLQSRMTAKIHRDAILGFISESGYLSCEIEIGKEKLDGFVLEELQEFLPVVSLIGGNVGDIG